MTQPSPPSLGGWTLLELLGKGGMGEVWRAERAGPASIKRRAALKRILPQYQRDPVLRERFLAEARITARLEHPNIVQVLDFGDTPELYLALEFVDGAPLSELLQRAATGAGELPIAAALYAIAEAATGLDHAHRRTDEQGQPLGIVHRDVSPTNVLVSLDGAVKVSDFGVARAADNLLRTQHGLAVGKLVYMAPEQARGEPVDRRADVFSLAVVLWELLALRPLLPRGAPNDALEALTRCEFVAPSQFRKGIPPELDALVLSALSLDKTRRPSTADVLSRSLRSILVKIAPTFTEMDMAEVLRVLVPRFSKRQTVEPPSVGVVSPAVSEPRAKAAEAPTSVMRAPAPPPASPPGVEVPATSAPGATTSTPPTVPGAPVFLVAPVSSSSSNAAPPVFAPLPPTNPNTPPSAPPAFAAPGAAPLHLAFAAPAQGHAAIVPQPARVVAPPRKKRSGCVVALMVLGGLGLCVIAALFFFFGSEGCSGITGSVVH